MTQVTGHLEIETSRNDVIESDGDGETLILTIVKWSGKWKYFNSVLCKPNRNTKARLRKDILGHIL